MNFFIFQYLVIKDFILVLFSICFLLSITSNTSHFFSEQSSFSFFFIIFLLLISIYNSKSNLLRYIHLLTNKKKQKYENKIKRHIFNDVLFLVFIIMYFQEQFVLKYYIIILNLLSIINLFLTFSKKNNNEIELQFREESQQEIELQYEDEINQPFPDPEIEQIGELSIELPEYEPELIYR